MLLRRRPGVWILALLVAAAPTPSFAAQGVNLAWANCLVEGGTPNRFFACDTNIGSRVCTGSFELSSDMPGVVGTEIVLQLASASATLPDWWRFKNSGACRQTSMAVDFNANPFNDNCVDWMVGPVGGIGAYCTSTNQCAPSAPTATNVAIIRINNAVTQGNPNPIYAGFEYFDFNLSIDFAKTVGTGACGGCAIPVCIVLNSINVVSQAENRFLSGPAHPGSNYVTWQGGGVPVTPQGTGCPAATPTRKSTWGSVKSLYR